VNPLPTSGSEQVHERLTVIAAPETQVLWLMAEIERTVNETASLLTALGHVVAAHPEVGHLTARLLEESGFLDEEPNPRPSARSFRRVRSMPRPRR
jgi:hypothetical protein